MSELHLSPAAIEQYVEQTLNATAQADATHHLETCTLCRAQIAATQKIETSLRALPRATPPRELATLITTAVEYRTTQDAARRARAPFIAAATLFSALLLLWFGFAMIVALEDKNSIDFFFWLASHPEIVQTHFFESLSALLELLPIAEIFLTLFALFTVGVLAQQWFDTLEPQPVFAADKR